MQFTSFEKPACQASPISNLVAHSSLWGLKLGDAPLRPTLAQGSKHLEERGRLCRGEGADLTLLFGVVEVRLPVEEKREAELSIEVEWPKGEGARAEAADLRLARVWFGESGFVFRRSAGICILCLTAHLRARGAAADGRQFPE